MVDATQDEVPGEMYFDSLKVWGTNPDDDPNRIEWVRFSPDSPLADTPVAQMPHVSWTVDDLDEAIKECARVKKNAEAEELKSKALKHWSRSLDIKPTQSKLLKYYQK